MNEIDKQYSRLFSLQDDAVKPEYMEWLNLLINIDVITEALKVCTTIEFPEDPTRPLYVKFALSLQNYFINAQGLRENNKFSCGEQSERLKALATIAKSVRNTVAHEGIWIATPIKVAVLDKGGVSFYSYPKEELMKSLSNMRYRELNSVKRSISDKKKSEIKEKYDLAFGLLENQYQDEVFYISEFMKHHYKDFIGYILKIYRKKTIKKDFKKYSVLRKEAGFITIEERLEDITADYHNLCKIL